MNARRDRAAGAVGLFGVDPELAGGLSGARLAAARDAARVETERVAEGAWTPEPAGEDGFGLLILSGFLVRRVGREGRHGAELLGPGDLLRPWLSPGEFASQPFEPAWQAIAALELADLDGDFVRRMAPFPEVAVHLVERAMLRSRHLVLELAIVQERRVDRRLHMLLWHFADRWGHMTADGARVVAPLTHALLADLVAARRPSVSTALGRLSEAGVLTRVGDAWILSGDPPA
jgi:CRP/FNR family transcriptional regulator, cyclic AMP receptor protein